MKPGFNQEAFFSALDTERLARRKTWKQMAEESHVPASSLSRMGQGKKPDVETFAKLLNWSNLKAEDFIGNITNSDNPASLSKITSLLRADPTLSDESKKTLEFVITSTYTALLSKE